MYTAWLGLVLIGTTAGGFDADWTYNLCAAVVTVQMWGNPFQCMTMVVGGS